MNKHILIFEGPDRCGKTEIGKALSEILGTAYFKNSNEQVNFVNKNTLDAFKYETHYLLQLLKQIQFGANGIVLDRHFPSEYVYAHAYDRKTDDALIWWFDDEFAKLGAKIIYCYKSEYKNYDDEIIQLDDIKNIREQYETQYLPLSNMPIIKIDTSDENLPNQLSYILSQINK